MFKKVRVALLATNQLSRMVLGHKIKELYWLDMPEKSNNWTSQYLYFLSNDEIKEGDWIYGNCKHTSLEKDNYRVFECTRIGNTGIVFGEIGDTLVSSDSINWCKKIIATTDSTLIFNHEDFPVTVPLLPQPSQSFIEKYIKEYNNGTPITEVLVEYWAHTEEYPQLRVDPKDNTITIKKVKNSWSREEVVEKLIECCVEISSTNGTLIGKSPAELYKWIETNL